MADLPAEVNIPPVPSPTTKWFNEDGTPTVMFAQYMAKLRNFLKEQRALIEDQHP